MEPIKSKEQKAKEIIAPENEFKGYTIEEIRFQRALVAMEVEFSKAKIIKSWNGIQKLNPFSIESGSKLPVRAGSVAKRLVNGLNYMDYIMIGWSLFSGVKKVFSLFRRKKK